MRDLIGVPYIFKLTRMLLDGTVVYSESLKRELKTKTIYGYRCDESLKT